MDIVKIKSSTGVANGTMVTNAETGDEIKGITSLSIDIRANDLVRATISLAAVEVDVDGAAAEFHVANPKTGDIKAVRRIEFADGEVVDF
jgi:hypothetical protein